MKIMCEFCNGKGFYNTNKFKSAIYTPYTEIKCENCKGHGFIETEKGLEVVWCGPTNEAKDDAEMYCPVCDEHIPNDDWVYCHKCGVKLLIHGKDIY